MTSIAIVEKCSRCIERTRYEDVDKIMDAVGCPFNGDCTFDLYLNSGIVLEDLTMSVCSCPRSARVDDMYFTFLAGRSEYENNEAGETMTVCRRYVINARDIAGYCIKTYH